MDYQGFQESAILVNLHVRCWGAKTTDRESRREIAAIKSADEKMFVFYKKLINSPGLKRYANTRDQFRIWLNSVTFPWTDDSWRILRASYYDKFFKKARAYIEELDGFAAEIVSNYADDIEQARVRLGSAFNEHEYPSVQAIRSKFGADLQFQPVPSTDWRVRMEKEVVNAIATQTQARIEGAYQDTARQLWQRLYDRLEKVAEMLADTDRTVTEPLINGTARLAELLPEINLTGDKELDRLAEEMRLRLCGQSAKAIRENENLRNEKTEAARELLEAARRKMSVFGAPPTAESEPEETSNTEESETVNSEEPENTEPDNTRLVRDALGRFIRAA